MQITVASGKGGTGKTLVATSLSRMLAGQGKSVVYVDGDVDAPNGHLLLSPENMTATEFTVDVPSLNGERCSGCGRCQQVCQFNAILANKGDVIVFNELCHSCGACVLACPDVCLKEVPRPVGSLYRGDAGPIGFLGGRLNVGEARATPMIHGVVEEARKKNGADASFIVVDSPPGTSCGAMAACADADLLLFVTEPTPFGLHDLALAIEMGKALGRQMAAVVNRSDLGSADPISLLESAGVPLLAEIPFMENVARSGLDQNLSSGDFEALENLMKGLVQRLISLLEGNER